MNINYIGVLAELVRYADARRDAMSSSLIVAAVRRMLNEDYGYTREMETAGDYFEAGREPWLPRRSTSPYSTRRPCTDWRDNIT
jgi:hypothetical protein